MPENNLIINNGHYAYNLVYLFLSTRSGVIEARVAV